MSDAHAPQGMAAGKRPLGRAGQPGAPRWTVWPLTAAPARRETRKHVLSHPKGRQMKASYAATATVLCLAGLLAGCGGSGETTVKVIEHAETDTVRHIGPASESDSVGDVLAFANPVFDEGNKRKVGSDNGQCVRTVVGKAWECIWTVRLEGGQLTVEGPFEEGRDTVLAITGGSDEYKDASGQMKLHARNEEETEYDFVYEIDK